MSSTFRKNMINQTSFVLMIFVTIVQIKAGFRCRLGGDKMCSAGCMVLGQTSGICDDEKECW